MLLLTHRFRAPAKQADQKWTKQRQQQLAIFDPSTFTLTTFQRIYRVLHLTSFSTNQISGIDSPIYRPIPLQLDLDTERIDSTKQIKR